MNRTILRVLVLLLVFSKIQAQIPVLPNPSQCADIGWLEDYTCPGNAGYFRPNEFIIRVLEAPGSSLGQDVYLKEVRLIIGHTWTADLDVFLRSPSGKRVMLTSDNGGGEDDYGRLSPTCSDYTVFASASCFPIQSGRPPFLGGAYLPEEPLSTFEDGTSPLGDWVLQICDDSEQDSGRLHFVELVFDRIQCLPVQTIQIVAQDTTSAVLDWSPSGGCADVRTFIEYGPRGFTPGREALAGPLGKVIEVQCPPFTLKDLPPNADLDIYIRKSCSPESFSGNSCPISLQTACLPPGPATTENFTAAEVCAPVCSQTCVLSGIWQNTSGDNFDWLVYQGATPTQGTGPTDGVVPGGKYVYIETSGNQCSGRAILRSGCILLDKKNTTSCHLSFFYHAFGSNIGSLALEASSDGAVWATLWQVQGNQGNEWKKVYISLNAFSDGSQLQFRFVATKGSGPLGDIALTEITFHGSSYLGMPAFRFYADRDSDGYGDPGRFVDRCDSLPPLGYVAIAGDCDDFSALVNPGMQEVPCDGTDNNCNGLSDDTVLPPPLAWGDTVCSGENARLKAVPAFGSVVLWYDVAQGGEPLGFSLDFTPFLPPNTGSSPITYRFFAEAADDQLRCFSSKRTEVVVVVHPLPLGLLAPAPAFCPGDSLDLAALPIEDLHFTSASVSFHTGIPATQSNQILKSKILPFDGQRFSYLLTSPEGCLFVDTFSLKERMLPEVDLLPADSFALCTGAFRTVEASVRGGAGEYRYLWQTGDTTANIKVLGGTVPGQRVVTALQVTDAAGCRAYDTLKYVTISSIDSLFREVVDAGACGTADGSIFLRPFDGIPPFSYRWTGSNGIQGESLGVTTVPFAINNLSPGTYRITITDSSNEKCAFVLPPTYVNGIGAQVNGIRITPARCAGTATGSVCLEVSAESKPSFRWSSGDSTACVSGLRSGIYAVTIQENGCTSVLDSIIIPESPPLRAVAEIKPASCTDTRDGAINVAAYGGNGGYRFRWGNGFLTAGISELLPGSYPLTITDVEGCELIQQFQVPSPVALTVVADSLAGLRCPQGSDGYIQVVAKGGTAPYKYSWEDGAGSPLRKELEQGTYRVLVQDFNGCTATAAFEILAPAALKASVAIQVMPLCPGDSSGVLEAKGQGGRLPYQFFWKNGISGPNLTNVGAGIYEVWFLDSLGCQSDTAVALVAPPEGLRWNAAIIEPLCVGRSEGQIALRPTGRAPFRFLWSRGDTTATLSGLADGHYSVSVEDAAGCRYDTSFELSVQEAPIKLGTVAIPPSCTGGSDGLIRLEPQQVRYPPLLYRWENGSVNRELSALREGSYQVTVTDGAGCQLIEKIRLDNPAPLSYALTGMGNIICKGDSTGFLELEVMGGVPPYTYRWIGSSSTNASAYRLGAGEYRFFAQDSKGCPLNGTFLLEEPPAIRVEAEVSIGNICIGDTSNQLKAIYTGGVPPYSLRWNNGRTEPILKNVPPGDYAFAVRDSNGCQQVLPTFKVRDQGRPLELANFQVRDISCFGEKDGSLNISVRGGRPPFTYVFKGTSTTVQTFQSQWTLTGLGPRNSYGVVVSDALGCRIETVERPLREPPLLNVRRDSIQLVNCKGPNSGAIYITASGGTPPYAFNWFEGVSGREVATTEDLISFPGGNYSVLVTDSRLCSDTLAAINIPTRSSLQLVGSPLITDNACKGDKRGSIVVELEGGRPPYTYYWNGKIGNSTLRDAAGGNYELTVVDSDSCRTTFPLIKIGEPDQGIAATAVQTPVRCPSGMDGGIRVMVSGVQGVFQAIWSNAEGQTIALDTLRLDSLKAGAYRLQIRDQQGCSAEFGYEVVQPQDLKLVLHSTPSDPGGDGGTLKAEVSGGTAPYQYIWNTGDTTAQLEGLSPDRYSLTVTDANGCVQSDSLRLTSTRVSGLFEQGPVGRIFPNPARSSLFIELEFPSRPVRPQWKMIDLRGRVVRTGALSEEMIILQEVHIDDLPASWYILMVYDAFGRLWSEKWVKI